MRYLDFRNQMSTDAMSTLELLRKDRVSTRQEGLLQSVSSGESRTNTFRQQIFVNWKFSSFQIKHNSSTDEYKDQGTRTGTISSPDFMMKNGGCKSPMGVHRNGDEWHPIIATFGEQKCVKCSCKVSIHCEISCIKALIRIYLG